MSKCRNYLVIVLEGEDLIFTISLKGETFLDALIDRMLLSGHILGYEVTQMILNMDWNEIEDDLTEKDFIDIFVEYCCEGLHYYLIDITDPEKPIHMDFYDSIQ